MIPRLKIWRFEVQILVQVLVFLLNLNSTIYTMKYTQRQDYVIKVPSNISHISRPYTIYMCWTLSRKLTR